MSGLAILDLTIGLIFIYFLLSLICSVVQELLANLFHWRADTLNQWLHDTFSRQNLSKAILQHKLIDGLTAKGRLASYFPPDKFSKTVFDLVHREQFGDKPYTIETLRLAIAATSLLEEDLKRALIQSIAESTGEVSQVRRDFENWFNNAMERISGTYKKKTQRAILVLSLITVTLFNADSIELAKYLYDHPTVSKALADRAEAATRDSSFIELTNKIRVTNDSLTTTELQNTQQQIQQLNTNLEQLKKLATELETTTLPLGWEPVKNWPSKFFGLLITALAVALGAPFWFDMLNKLVNIRSSGKKPAPHES